MQLGPSIVKFVMITTCLIIRPISVSSRGTAVAGDQRGRTSAMSDILVLAQCESRCYLHIKSSVAMTIEVNGHNFTLYECITSDCHQCVNATLRPITELDGCYAFCGNRDSCRHSCNCVYSLVSKGVGRSELTTAEPLTPKMACQDIISRSTRTSSNWDQLASFHVQITLLNGIELATDARVPTLFVVEARRKSNGSDVVGDWKLIGKTNRPFLEVSDLTPAHLYQFRTQSVAPDGILATSNVSDWLSILPVNAQVEPPRQLTHTGTYSEGPELVATFSWKPPLENFCFYDVFWFHPDSHKVDHKYIFLPIDGTEIKLTGLHFNANYTLQMVTRSGDGKLESDKFQTSFVTGSCLTTFGANFTLCGPGAPRDLNFTTRNRNESDKTASVMLSWKSPVGTTDSNSVLYYEVKMTKAVSFQSLPSVAPFVYKTNVPGNSSQVIVDSVPLKSSYIVSVIAVSKGGHGEEAITQFLLTANQDKPRASQTLLFFIISPFLLFVIVAAICIVAYRSHRHHLAKTNRNRYFESLEQSQPLEKCELASGFGGKLKQSMSVNNPAFEVHFDTLLMGEVIGRGAFGLVRKAQICKPWALWETVAVKMLHPGYSEQDERYLLEEIEMMKSVGQHPNLVSLIAYCPNKPNVCLVVEHCPHGDLQTYLRAFRNRSLRKSLNDSGMVDQHCVIQETSLDSSSSCFSDDCDESEDGLPPRSKFFEQYGGESTIINDQYLNFDADMSNDVKEEEVKFSSNDLLSFSRQVSMGMEYLSQNKLVHRDLAARNVLVYDRKFVKVSDFGLMRDVYENNVYRRKTDGKLPVKWMAYESIFDQVFTTKSDVWSFGVLLYEIATLGGTPYPGIGNIQLVELLKKEYRMEKPPNCDDTLYAMMTSCWQNIPSNRPSFTELRHQLESILENSLNYLILDLSFDEDSYYKVMSRKTTRSISTTDDSTLTPTVADDLKAFEKTSAA